MYPKGTGPSPHTPPVRCKALGSLLRGQARTHCCGGKRAGACVVEANTGSNAAAAGCSSKSVCVLDSNSGTLQIFTQIRINLQKCNNKW